MVQEAVGPRRSQILLFGVISGVFEALAIVFINQAVVGIRDGAVDFRYLGLFACSIALYLYGDRLVLTECLSAVGKHIYDTHLRIVKKMCHARTLEFEQVERPKINSALAENTDIIVEATRYMADGISNATMLLISAAYIYFLSPQAFLMVLVLNAIALYLFVWTQRIVSKDLGKVKQLGFAFQAQVNQILLGFKEMKVNTAKQEDILDNHISQTIERCKEVKIATEIKSSTSFLYTRSFFFILVACVVFLLPQMMSVETTTITAIIAVVLFTIGPLGQLILGIPFFTKADLALEGIRELENRLDDLDDMRHTAPESRLVRKRDFQELRFKDLFFSYAHTDGQQAFTVGPVNMRIRQGELVIISGGNGSGKSTLLKLFSGLYYPLSGSIHLDDILIKPGNYQHYREFFSIILSDFHVFDRLYGFHDLDRDLLQSLLDRMQLSKKTSCIDGRFTNLDLSSGQKKRLALVMSQLENRPILVYDEIAADLDPEFRAYFYDVHLPELRKSGKTIIAVSHDDRYFHVGDRLITMEYGQVVDEQQG